MNEDKKVEEKPVETKPTPRIGGVREPKKLKQNTNRRLFYFKEASRAAFVAKYLDLLCFHVRWSPVETVANYIETSAKKMDLFRVPKGEVENWKEEKAIGFALDFKPVMVPDVTLPVETVDNGPEWLCPCNYSNHGGICTHCGKLKPVEPASK